MDDIPAIHAVNKRAFNRENEAQLVDRLREAGAVILSLVAGLDGRIVGHVLFSPVTIADGDSQWQAVGLGPVAVLPELQNRGIGATLICSGLGTLKESGHDVIVVLGRPGYYPRFGFKPSKPLGVRWENEAPEDAFMLLELRSGALRGRKGVVRYHRAFGDV